MRLASKLLILVGLSICACTGLPGASAIAGECPCDEAALLGARLKILLLRYGGAEQGEALNQYSSFVIAITNRLNSLGPEMQDLVKDTCNKEAFRYLDDLEVEPQDTDPTTSLSDRYGYWEDTKSLELLRGKLLQGRSRYSVQSHIYIGDLQGQYPRKEVTVKLPLLDEEGPAMLDSHSVVTLYALAMDASKLGCEWLARTFLEAAFSTLQNLKGPGRTLQGHLIELEDAIKHEMERIKKARSGKG